MTGKVQCFFNLNYNHGSDGGQLKFAWGFAWFYLIDNEKPLYDQLIDAAKIEKSNVFNLNLTALTPFTNDTLEGK